MRFAVSAIVCACVLSLPTCGWSQTTTYGTASVSLGGNTLGGVIVPGGLQTGGTSVFDQRRTVFDGMKQQSCVAPFCPGWIDVWDTTGSSPQIEDGQSVNWTVDTPQGPGGKYHSVYLGTFHVTWNWMFWCNTYSVSYGVVTTYEGGG